ncbi:MAG: ASKHA domain-containing protein [Chloroflexota bacterium]|nr:ASKHA domain-containing protein [Chloroflexota bacterium]
MSNYKFVHENKSIELSQDKSLFDLADQVKMRIPTSCGRVGDCHECIVEVSEGLENLSERSEHETFLTEPYRLACQSKIISLRSDISFTPRKRDRKILTNFSGSNKYDIDHNYQYKNNSLVLINDGEEKIISKSKNFYGLAVDIGTTTVAINLVNLDDGKIIITSSFENPQVFGGSDVMNRISYDSSKFKGELCKSIISSINFEIGEYVKKIKIRRNEIVEAVIVGNATMRDLFFDLDVESIGVRPYKSIIELDYLDNKVDSTEMSKYAKEINLRINPNAIVYSPPLIASHIGSDVSAGLISTDFFENKNLKMLIDIGTNTEVVLGTPNRMLAASCPAGPAFEGGEITFGMPGYTGAVEKVDIYKDKFRYKTIGDVEATGICGSGLIDFLSVLVENKLMNPLGKFTSEEDKMFLDNEQAINLSRKDVSSLAQAKAANVCGQALVIKDFGKNILDIENVYLAGGFANYIDIQNAINIGFILDFPLEKIKKIGNSALEGATKLLLSNKLRKNLVEYVNNIDHLELETKSDFFDYFVEGCQFKKISI